ncbi:glutamine synthetase family protein [Nocardioides antri]|uniref:Glutamine synthetase n=1 Tax=Nocardioides antri TaxID=2607659 RepID=A0A5B1M893_9ACTN|nr:glutamine synthetase family protein [Nocardioides antri]KAA1428097.1 glutamine synthetase [Nocardioides antri]
MQAADVRQWLADNGITSVQVQATNLDGTFIGKTLSCDKFLGALDQGVAFADVVFGNDLGNFPILGVAFPSWRGELEDIFLRPDLGTLCVWRPGVAAAIGDFWTSEGDPVGVCPRNLLRKVTAQAAELGYGVTAAVEIEATIFEEPVQEARAKGYQGLTPLGGTAGSAYVLGKSADWREYLEAVEERLRSVGIAWEAWNDEAAVGQVEVNVPVGDIVDVADRWARTRQVMREVAYELGHSVTFMAKWSDAWGQASHLNVSLADTEGNAFYSPEGASEVMRHFIGGVMAAMAGTTSLALPFITSYRRLVPLEGPPTTITWGHHNKSTAVRAVTGHPAYSRIEYRLPGSDANVYLVAAAVAGAGLYGVINRVEPPAPFAGMAWGLPEGSVEQVPATISQAAAALEADKILPEVLGEEFVTYWLGTRRWEWIAFHTMGGGDLDAGLTAWESARYFELV